MYLVTTLGLLLLLYQGIIVDLHAVVLFDTPKHFLTNNLVRGCLLLVPPPPPHRF